eukprot:jgi/Mesvir1/4714/Mv05636-RA.2
MMHGFLPVMSTVCDDLLACLRCVPPSIKVDMNDLLHKSAMDVIGEVALGVRFGLMKEELQHLTEARARPAGSKGVGGKESVAAKGLTHRAGASKGAGMGAGPKVANGIGKGPENNGDVSQQGSVPDDGRQGTDLVLQHQAKQAAWTGEAVSARELYKLIMEGIKMSTFEASISNLLAMLCGPLGRGLRALLSRVPGTADHRFLNIQKYKTRFCVQMCIARKGGMCVSGGSGLDVAVGAPSGTDAAGNGSVSANGGSPSDSETHVKDAMTFLLSTINKDTKQPFSMENIAGLTKELVVGGSDTTANTLAFALYCVSGDPAVEARVVEEVLAPGRGPGVPLTHEDLEDKFPYVEAVIKESLRMYPPVNGMQREALEDVELGGHFIPRGTAIMMPAMAMNRDPAIHLTPDSFWPDRFLANAKSDYAFQFSPFGIGPRMCIGHRFAMVESMLVFIRLYQSFHFKRAPPTDTDVPIKLAHTVVTKPKNGVWVYVVPRTADAVSE